MLEIQSIIFPSLFALVGAIIIIMIAPLLKKILPSSSSSVAFIREMAVYTFILFVAFIIISKISSNGLVIYICLGIFALVFAARAVRHVKIQIGKEKEMEK